MSNFRERLEKEIEELDYKLTKLNTFISLDVFKGLDEDQQVLLRTQSKVMDAYLTILNERMDRLTSEPEQGIIPNVNDFSFKEIIDAVNFGFWYATNSQNDGYVPEGNTLQWIMGERKLMEIPDEWEKHLDRKKDDK